MYVLLISFVSSRFVFIINLHQYQRGMENHKDTFGNHAIQMGYTLYSPDFC